MVRNSNKPDKGKAPQMPQADELPAASSDTIRGVPSEASSQRKGVRSPRSHRSEAASNDEDTSTFGLAQLLQDDAPSAEAIRRGVDFFYQRLLESERREDELQRQYELDRQREKDRKELARMERLKDLARERRRAELVEAQRRMYRLGDPPAKATSGEQKGGAPKRETTRYCQCDSKDRGKKQTAQPVRKDDRDARWKKASAGPSGYYRRRPRSPSPFGVSVIMLDDESVDGAVRLSYPRRSRRYSEDYYGFGS